MRTVEIIFQLIDAINKNPMTISQISWEDIKLCVVIELEEHLKIYSQSHIKIIQSLFDELLNKINQSVETANINLLVQYLKEIAHMLQVMPEQSTIDKISLQANFDHACLNHYKNDTIIVLGDSHVNFFSGNEFLSFLPIGHEINTCIDNTLYPFTVLHTGPCLAYTCNKADTTYHFKDKVEYLCQEFIRPGARIICSLGEIDLRVHVFQQTMLQNKNYIQIVDNILMQYLQFLIGLKDRGYLVYCWGPIASQSASCPVDENFPRNGSEVERNKATAYFNHQLRLLCEEHDIGFLSIFDKMITSDYQTLTQYLSSDQCHLGQNALSLAEAEWHKVLNI